VGRKPKGSVKWDGEAFRARIRIAGEDFDRLFPTEAEGEGYLAALIELKAEAKRAPTTLASFGLVLLEEAERAGRPHIDKRRSLWRAHVESWKHSHRPIASLQRKHVADHLRALAESGDYERQTVQHVLVAIRTALTAAADRGLVKANVAIEVKVPRMPKGEGEAWAWLTVDEIKAVLGCAQPTECALERRATYATAIYTGLRKSELWHLRWERVHLDGPRPRIEVREPLKTDYALRDVPLLPPAIEALRAWRDRGGVRRARGFVFPSVTFAVGPNGKKRRVERLHDDSFDAGWRDHPYTVTVKGKKVRKVREGTKARAGIARRVRFHDLRHTCASHLVQGTWGRALSLHEVKQWLGHSSIGVTQRYAHLSPGGIHALAKEMAEQLAKK
jgi:integrase